MSQNNKPKNDLTNEENNADNISKFDPSVLEPSTESVVLPSKGVYYGKIDEANKVLEKSNGNCSKKN